MIGIAIRIYALRFLPVLLISSISWLTEIHLFFPDNTNDLGNWTIVKSYGHPMTTAWNVYYLCSYFTWVMVSQGLVIISKETKVPLWYVASLGLRMFSILNFICFVMVYGDKYFYWATLAIVASYELYLWYKYKII